MNPESAESREEPDDVPPSPNADHCRVISSQSLFGEDREIRIEHHGEEYRLRITRRGKLILQK